MDHLKKPSSFWFILFVNKNYCSNSVSSTTYDRWSSFFINIPTSMSTRDLMIQSFCDRWSPVLMKYVLSLYQILYIIFWKCTGVLSPRFISLHSDEWQPLVAELLVRLAKIVLWHFHYKLQDIFTCTLHFSKHRNSMLLELVEYYHKFVIFT